MTPGGNVRLYHAILLRYYISYCDTCMQDAYFCEALRLLSVQLKAEAWLCGRTPACHADRLGSILTWTQHFYYLFYLQLFRFFDHGQDDDFSLTTNGDDTDADTDGGISAIRGGGPTPANPPPHFTHCLRTHCARCA